MLRYQWQSSLWKCPPFLGSIRRQKKGNPSSFQQLPSLHFPALDHQGLRDATHHVSFSGSEGSFGGSMSSMSNGSSSFDRIAGRTRWRLPRAADIWKLRGGARKQMPFGVFLVVCGSF